MAEVARQRRRCDLNLDKVPWMGEPNFAAVNLKPRKLESIERQIFGIYSILGLCAALLLYWYLIIKCPTSMCRVGTHKAGRRSAMMILSLFAHKCMGLYVASLMSTLVGIISTECRPL